MDLASLLTPVRGMFRLGTKCLEEIGWNVETEGQRIGNNPASTKQGLKSQPKTLKSNVNSNSKYYIR